MTFRRCVLPLAGLLGLTVLLNSAGGQDIIKKEEKKESRKDAIKRVIARAEEDYRTFFKPPTSLIEYWAAINFEIQVGKFDVAAFHLDLMLKFPLDKDGKRPKDKEGKELSDEDVKKLQEQADQQLLDIEEADGLNAFLRLRLVKEWNPQPDLEKEARANVDKLIDRVMALLEKRLSDPERHKRFIEGLFDKVPEVRAFSLYHLRRASHRAAPTLAETLRTSKPAAQNVLKGYMLQLEPDIMPPMLELYRARDVKEAADIEFRLNLLWLAKMRIEKRVIPYLWHLSSAPQYPKVVRDEARNTLAVLLDTTPDRLPPAKVALTELAEKYYQYKVRWPDTIEVADRDNPEKLLVMPAYKKWFISPDGQINPTAEVLRPDDARFDFGLRYAAQALDLDKSYLPAQTVFLAFLLEVEFARKPFEGRLDKLLTEPRSGSLQRLLAKIDYELLSNLLERAVREQNYAVMLPLIDAAGERGEVRLAQPAGNGSPGILEKLLYYPDLRVQYAAARALLRLPAAPTPVASTRIVQVLTRFLATPGGPPRVLIVHARDERATVLRNAAREAGYEPDVAATVKEAAEMLHRSAGYDAILLNNDVATIELPHVISQLRADQDGGRLPLLLIAPRDREAELTAVAAKARNTFMLPDVWAIKGAELKRQLADAIKFAAAPEPLRKAPAEQQPWLQYEVLRSKGQAVTEGERKLFAHQALDWFAQMARGELPGYDLMPAKDALVQALNNEEMAGQALRIIARFNNTETQQRLAGILLDAKKTTLHVRAAHELNRHIQKNGLVLKADQINQLREMDQRADLPPALRAELAILVGTLRTTPQATGEGLLRYIPDPEPKK
jgi:CheY-like chemotaxis protein